MTDPKETQKPEIKTRQPKKATPGIFDNLRLPQAHPVEEILGLVPVTELTPSRPSIGSRASTGGRGSTDTRASTPSTPSTGGKQPVAPDRDYTKVANSIVRQAVPEGLFGEQGGKSKELYDTLYHLTRGAVVPKRKIRIPKDELMRKAGIGSEVTLRKNLMRLRGARLIKEVIVPGAHGGNEYEVFLPEEVGRTTPSTPSTASTPSTPSNPRQMREGVEALASTGSRASSFDCNTTTSGDDKTLSLRPQETIDDDDAALAGLVRVFKETSIQITGKDPSPLEADRWRELAEVIAAEGKIAAARTTISSVPAFLAEHLRRRLWKIDKKQARAEGRELPDENFNLAPSKDASGCPDCSGSGWWYPQGPERGVAKCGHTRLRQASEESK